jgi:hypothetical protein
MEDAVITVQSVPVSSTNKTESHDITEILLKVALNTINLMLQRGVHFRFQNELSFLALAFILPARVAYSGLVKSSK